MENSLTPNNLKNFILNKEIADKLLKINPNNVINLLVYGRPNTGRKTLVYAFLNHINNCDVLKSRSLNSCELKIGNNKVNIDYISSPYHIELNLYEYGLYDKNIINDFLIEHTTYKSINNIKYKFIVINHFDFISKASQVCLKLLLDKCSDNVRFIFIADNMSRIDNSIISRTSLLKVRSSTPESIKKYIKNVSDTKYKISIAHKKLIAQQCGSDLFAINNAIVCFHYNKKIDLKEINVIDKQINEIITLINEKNLKTILKIRQICYNLLLINVTLPFIFKKIFNHYISSNNLNEKCKQKLVEDASTIEARMCNIEHDLICFEYFALKVKKLLISN